MAKRVLVKDLQAEIKELKAAYDRKLDARSKELNDAKASHRDFLRQVAIKLSQFDGLSWAIPPGYDEMDLLAVCDRFNREFNDGIAKALDSYKRDLEDERSHSKHLSESLRVEEALVGKLEFDLAFYKGKCLDMALELVDGR